MQRRGMPVPYGLLAGRMLAYFGDGEINFDLSLAFFRDHTLTNTLTWLYYLYPT
jgi:hypothetical protein